MTPAYRDSPGRLLTLLDIMNTFECFDLLTHVLALSRYEAVFDQSRRRGEGASGITDEGYQEVKNHCDRLVEVCMSAGLKQAQRKAAMTAMHLKEKGSVSDVSSMATEIRNVLETLWLNTHDVAFLFVQPDRSRYIDNPAALFSEKVLQAFPGARPDMREAGNCLASDCNTAAVFHLMRVVEWGLRAFCAHLGFSRLKRKYKKQGRVRYVPVEFSEWEHILNELSDRVEKKLGKIKRGEVKQEQQRYYHPLLEEILSLRDGWRNHTMHARQDYGATEADVVLQHVQRFMTKLSERVSQV